MFHRCPSRVQFLTGGGSIARNWMNNKCSTKGRERALLKTTSRREENLATTWSMSANTSLVETINTCRSNNRQEHAPLTKCSRMHLRVMARQRWRTSSRALRQTFGAPVFNTACAIGAGECSQSPLPRPSTPARNNGIVQSSQGLRFRLTHSLDYGT